MRTKQLYIPLSDDEMTALKKAADEQASPLATWARSVLVKSARKGGE